MADFQACLTFAIQKLAISFELKKEQRDALEFMFELKDTVGVLPTGFGKSLIFQLLPFLYQAKYGTDKPSIVIVCAPLNSILENQVLEVHKTALKACCVAFDGSRGTTCDDPDEESSEAPGIALTKTVTVDDLQRGNYDLIYAHPEALQGRVMQKMMRSRVYQTRVGAVVVDEVHMISEWGDKFRPAFKSLGTLTCLFPNAGHMALTATATSTRIKELCKVLEYRNPEVVSVNPDRPNICIDIRSRLPNIHKFEKFDQLINPIASELKSSAPQDFPVTIVYMESLEALGYCYSYLDSVIGQSQYIGDPVPENRIFAQYHKDYTTAMKAHIVQELTKEEPKLRLVLATVALGMGLNAPSVCRIIHSRPPTNLEAYMQEIGRAGRQGQSAIAIMYFNNNDLSAARKGLTDEMIKFCRNNESCLRLHLVQHFGFDQTLYSGDPKECCCNCKKITSTSDEI